MYRKITAVIFVAALLAASFGAMRLTAPQANGLAALLPDSDGVVAVDMGRLMSEALPQILAANEPALSKVNGELEKIKTRTGIDIRQFESIAVGTKAREFENGELDLQPLLLASGRADEASLAEAARYAADGEPRTEQIAGRTVHIFTAKAIVEKNRDTAKTNGFLDQIVNKVIGGLNGEIALTAYDSGTVALGPVNRVRELLGGGPRISANLLGKLDKSKRVVGSFAMVVPEGLSRYLELGDDELGDGLDSVREIDGSLDVVPGKALVSINARTADAEMAESLAVMVEGFQAVFAAILKRQQGADKKVYGRMLESLGVARKNDRIELRLEIPQKDIDVIVGKK